MDNSEDMDYRCNHQRWQSPTDTHSDGQELFSIIYPRGAPNQLEKFHLKYLVYDHLIGNMVVLTRL
jgi:hypothetical protein